MENEFCLEISWNLDYLDFIMEKSWNIKKSSWKIEKYSGIT